MRKHWMRLLSGFLCLIMVLALLPMQALADEYAAHAEQQALDFRDVESSDWFYDAVRYAKANGFFNGTSASTFSPNDTMTRGMFVTVLGRMAGIDPADYAETVKFTDVPKNSWYAPYVVWAVRYGITSGTSDTTFSPDAPVTRQEMAVFFVRYFELFGVTCVTDEKVTTTPEDMEAVAVWAREAVQQLWAQGLLNGDGKNFDPKGSATRAQVATLCMRTDKAVETWYSEPGVPSERVSVDPSAEEKSEEAKNQIISNIIDTPSAKEKYTITLNLPEGKTATVMQTNAELNISGLATPAQDGYYFLGWYYDAAYTRQALDGDTLTAANTTLYAKMLKSGEIETSETPYYTVITDVEDDFTITVNSTSNKDLTDKITVFGPEQYVDEATDEMEILTVTRIGNTYLISAPNSKLIAGGAYQVVLEDDALSFDGETMASIREYHFTVKQDEPVMNLHLKESVKEIPVDAIGNGAQIAAQNLSPVTVLAGESGSVTTSTGLDEDSGSFTYDGELNIGDTVAIYEGGKPSERTATTNDLGAVSYVTITGKNGNVYTYTAATTEEVLFIPDVLPIQSGWDADTTDGTVLTIAEADLLTALSEVNAESLDKGDFLAFYEGLSMETATSVIYGCVTDFSESDGIYIIDYEAVTQEEVLSSMDFSTTSNVSGEELLAGADIEAMEENIAQQAISSGFVQVVAQNFAAAVSTMDLSELADGELDLSNVDLSGLAAQDLSFGTLQSVSVSTDAAEGGGGGGGPEVKIESVRAQISTNLDHFKGMSGVRIALEMKISIEFDAGEEGESITIELTPTFVQELKLDISSKGGVKWKKKWIFPYMYDLYASVSVDMYTYTSINLNATISSGGEDDTPSKVKDLVEKVSGVAKDLSAIVKGENIEVTQGISDLQDLYCEMLENDTEWITLYRKNINEQNWNVTPFIKIKLAIDFVVQANVNVSMGLEFDYENAKRYNYTVYIFHGKSTNNTINLVTESYNLQLYAMGVLGIRAGVEVSLSVALITEKIAAVGIVVNVGAYLKVYGYVVYELHHVAGQKNTSKGSGALYIEVGCYLDIGMDLTAFGGKLSWKPTLYANEWPLWTAGSTLAASGFAVAPDEDDEDAEIPVAYMRKAQTAIDVPGELLTMAGFDMRTGADAELKYDVSLFDISFSDSRFKMENGKITLDFGDGLTWQTYPGRELECDMIITWKGAPLSFNTETIQIKTKVHWDQYEEYSYATFDVQGADKKIATMKLKSTDTLTIPEMTDDDHPGYYFRGWTVERILPDGTLETLEVTGNTVEMLGYDLRLTANWEAKTDIGYWIQPMFQQLDGSYVKGEAYEVKDGQVDIEFAPTLTPYEGYVTPDIGNRHRIKADGTSVIIAHYPLQQYSFVRYLYENGSFISGAYRYGETIDWTAPTREGYTFAGWSVTTQDGEPMNTRPLTMPAYGLIVTATWTPNPDTPFTVYTYTQKEDGSYTLRERLTYTGTTDTVAKTSVAHEGTQGDMTFTLPTYEGYRLRENCRSIVIGIKGDGTAYENYYYDLTRATLIIYHTSDNGKIHDSEIVSSLGAEAIAAPTKTFTGYTLEGYYTDSDCTNKVDYPTVLTDDLTLYARWTPNTVGYTVEHYQAEPDGSYPAEPTETETLTGSVDQTVTPDRKSYEGFTAPEGTQFTLTAVEENNVIRYQYARRYYTLTLNYGDGRADSEMGIPFGTTLSPDTPTRTGYTFGGWYTDSGLVTRLADDATMPAYDLTLYAKWTAKDGIGYKVEHYQQNVAGEDYTLVDTDDLTGTADAQTAAAARSYEGFTAQSFTQQAIAGDGSTVVKIYYTRNEYTLTYDLNAEGAAFNDSDDAAVTCRYGATISLPTAQSITYTGHSLQGWYTDEDCTDENKVTSLTMPAYSLTLYAKWTLADTGYTVNVYLQNVDGEGYTLSSADSYTGEGAFDSVAPAPQAITGFTAPDASTLRLTMTAGENVIDYYYTRNQYQLSYGGLDDVTWAEEGSAPTAGQIYYGAAITAPDMEGAVRTGYTFTGWYTDSGCTTALDESFTMPAAATTIYADWEPITYILRFNADGNVPLKTWLLAQEGARETEIEPDEGGSYENNGIPYIDITVTYDTSFALPTDSTEVTVNGAAYTLADCGVTGFSYGGGYYDEAAGSYVEPTKASLGGSIRNAADTANAIVAVSIQWPTLNGSYENPSTEEDPARIYNTSQLWEVFAVACNYNYPYSELMVDLEIHNQTSLAGLTQGVGNGCFNGNGHTIKALNAANPDSGRMGTLDRRRKENFTVKNVTLEGFTVNFDHSTEFTNNYGYYGGLFGEVGDNFVLENVTIKDLTLNLTLNGEVDPEGFQFVERDCIGGLVGYAAGSVTLKDCTITGTVMNVTLPEDSTAAIGSLIGYAAGEVTIENCAIDDVEGYEQIGATATTTDSGTDPADSSGIDTAALPPEPEYGDEETAA